MLKDFIDEYARYRRIGEKAIQQLADTELNIVVSSDINSIAIIVRHISGNFISRFTDFLSSDGEKPWRDRDSEFQEATYTRDAIEKMWAEGWRVLESELATLTDEQLQNTVSIRGQPWTVHDALCRSLAHVSYHIGQIVVMARILKQGDWDWISIPRNKSRDYNTNPTMEKIPER